MTVPDVATMATEEKVGQMMMVRYPDRGILEAMLRAGTAGAFYFGMKGLSAAEVAETLNRLQAMAKVPALIAFGSATTSCGTGLLRGSQMRIGATRSPELAYQIADREACEQRAYGCHIIDSPCLDVNTNPANPIINTRAFGDDPELVAELGLAMLQGIMDARAVTCGMHFPGHGATADDSHIRMPVDSRDAETLWRVDLLPWRRAIERNLLNAVCTNHVHYPALAPGRVEPATVSRAVITGLLREKLGYQGLIMSDSLTMKPMKDEFGIAEAAVRTVLAGHNIILQDYQSDPAITLRALVEAVEADRTPVEQVNASVTRILAVKHWLGLFDSPLVDVGRLAERVATADNRAFAMHVARQAVTALEADALPLRIPQGAVCVAITHGGVPAADMTRRAPRRRPQVYRDSYTPCRNACLRHAMSASVPLVPRTRLTPPGPRSAMPIPSFSAFSLAWSVTTKTASGLRHRARISSAGVPRSTGRWCCWSSATRTFSREFPRRTPCSARMTTTVPNPLRQPSPRSSARSAPRDDCP